VLFSFVIPFIFSIIIFSFPATIAMFAVAKNLIIKIETNKNILSQYYINYKKHYKKSLLSGFPITVIWLFLIVDFFIFLNVNKLILTVLIMFCAILFTLTINYLSTIVFFEENLLDSFKRASFLTVANPTLILTIPLGSLLLIYLSIYFFQFLLLLCTGALIALYVFYLYYQFLKKINVV